jgi:hypothetical protein
MTRGRLALDYGLKLRVRGRHLGPASVEPHVSRQHIIS